MSELWTVHRVARFLDVSRKRVYQFIASGKLVSLKLGPRTTRITRESVEAFLNDRLQRQKEELGLDLPQAPGMRRGR